MEERADCLPLTGIEEIETELKYNLPPWAKASLKQKVLLAGIKTVIYMPALIVMLLTGTLYFEYIFCYIQALLLKNISNWQQDFWQFDRIRGLICCFSMSIFVGNFIFSYFQAVITDPGSVPKTEEWELGIEVQESSKKTTERRKDGTERICKECETRKPDRCHHCKQCDRCVLKMDHHCAWIINCVGYKNYKYFFLAIFYASLALSLFICTFWEAVIEALLIQKDARVFTLFIVSSYMIGTCVGILMIGFLGFHVCMTWNNLTTLEYCEKNRRTGVKMGKSVYSSTVLMNFKEAFGNNLFLWLVPFGFNKAEDSGLYFAH